MADSNDAVSLSLYEECMKMWIGTEKQKYGLTSHFFAGETALVNLSRSPFFLTSASVTMPATTNLRILARQGKLSSKEDTEKILKLPVSYDTILDIFLQNREVMLREFSHDVGIPFHYSVLEEFRRNNPVLSNDIVVFDDERNESELVYGIGINRWVSAFFVDLRSLRINYGGRGPPAACYLSCIHYLLIIFTQTVH
jgi:hypothetical protein